METIIIKDNIKSISDLPKIKLMYCKESEEDHNIILFENILNNIKKLNKKKLIIELLNYKNIKDYSIVCNNNLYFTNIKFINMISTNYRPDISNIRGFNHDYHTLVKPSNLYKINISPRTMPHTDSIIRSSSLESTQYILYNKNINIIHLILFHDLNIDKVLIYLLYIYYILDENNRLSDHYSSIENYTIRYDICNTYILILIIKYYCSNVINMFNFNKPYIFDYSFNYEQIFLEGIEPLISNNEILELEDNNNKLTNEILELKDNNKILTNQILELKDNNNNNNNNKSLIKELINDLSKEHNSVLGELNNYKDQNKLLNKVIEKLESYNTLLTNKITDIENNNKILTDIIDDCNKN